MEAWNVEIFPMTKKIRVLANSRFSFFVFLRRRSTKNKWMEVRVRSRCTSGSRDLLKRKNLHRIFFWHNYQIFSRMFTNKESLETCALIRLWRVTNHQLIKWNFDASNAVNTRELAFAGNSDFFLVFSHGEHVWPVLLPLLSSLVSFVIIIACESAPKII